MKRLLKITSLAAVSTLLLTGCIKMDVNMDFAEGKVTPQVIMTVTQDFMDMGGVDGPTGIIKDMTQDELKEFCSNLTSDDGLGVNTGVNTVNETTASVNDEGSIVCTASGAPVDITDVQEDNEAMDVVFEKGTYTVTVKLSEMMGEETEGMDASMLRKAGVEFNMNLTFHRFVSAKVGDVDIKDLKGVTVSENTVTIDLLEPQAGDLVVVGSDTGSMWVFWFVLAGAVFSGAFIAFYVWGRKNKTADVPETAHNFFNDPSGVRNTEVIEFENDADDVELPIPDEFSDVDDYDGHFEEPDRS